MATKIWFARVMHEYQPLWLKPSVYSGEICKGLFIGVLTIDERKTNGAAQRTTAAENISALCSLLPRFKKVRADCLNCIGLAV
jgi:hypothetical protein